MKSVYESIIASLLELKAAAEGKATDVITRTVDGDASVDVADRKIVFLDDDESDLGRD